MTEYADSDIKDVTKEHRGTGGQPARVTLSLHTVAAEELDDLLTEGRGRYRGQSLSPVEAQLRRALRSGLKAARK